MQGRLQVRAGKVASISVEDAVHCKDGCSALRLFPANVCILCLKRFQPPLQSIATAIANVCGEDTPFVESLPPMFSDEPQI